MKNIQIFTFVDTSTPTISQVVQYGIGVLDFPLAVVCTVRFPDLQRQHSDR